MASKIKPTWKPEKQPMVEAALRASSTRMEAAKKLGVSMASLDFACRTYGISAQEIMGKEFDVVVPPPSELPIDDLIEHRIKEFGRKRDHEEARKLITIKLKSDLPMGILHFGDPHLDDDGTDLSLLREHGQIVRETEGLYAASVGDTTNNWVGRLAQLYGEQGTREADGWRLARWFIKDVVGRRKWLYLVGGNHDAWSGSGDPINWITEQVGALYQSSEVRIALRFPGGIEVRINCRHDFEGHSQWNPAHGPMKALEMGTRDHVAIAGHRHISGHGTLKDPDEGIAMHGFRVASYKMFDRYARQRGLRDQNLSPCLLTTINPRLGGEHPDLVKQWYDPKEGAAYLTWLRSKPC